MNIYTDICVHINKHIQNKRNLRKHFKRQLDYLAWRNCETIMYAHRNMYVNKVWLIQMLKGISYRNFHRGAYIEHDKNLHLVTNATFSVGKYIGVSCEIYTTCLSHTLSCSDLDSYTQIFRNCIKIYTCPQLNAHWEKNKPTAPD